VVQRLREFQSLWRGPLPEDVSAARPRREGQEALDRARRRSARIAAWPTRGLGKRVLSRDSLLFSARRQPEDFATPASRAAKGSLAPCHPLSFRRRVASPSLSDLRSGSWGSTPRAKVPGAARWPRGAGSQARAAREVVAREGIGCLRRRLVRRPKVEARRPKSKTPEELFLFTLQRSAQGDEFRFPKERAASRSAAWREFGLWPHARSGPSEPPG